MPLDANYGGILQAYALMSFLKENGYDVTLYNKIHVREISPFVWSLIYMKRFFMKYIWRQKNLSVFAEKDIKKINSLIQSHTKLFVDKYIYPIVNIENFRSIKKESVDIWVVGSDQIWRPDYFFHVEDAFLEFAKDWNVRRIAYAASFGVDRWMFSKKQTLNCQRLLKSFSFVGVREDSGVMLCRKYFDVNATHVLDPTMLLDVNRYVALMGDIAKNDLSEKGVMVYILDKTIDKQDAVIKLQTVLGYDIFYNNNPNTNDISLSAIERIASPVEEWLKGFSDAKYVITDSFHACVFSIMFNKPFVAYANKGRGLTRFHSLLRMFDLEDRLISSVTELDEQKINKKINWEKVNRILDVNRKKSKGDLYQNDIFFTGKN